MRRWLWQAHLQLDEPPGRVVHLAHGQAEPVPEQPEPLTAGPGDQLFGGLRRLFGDVGLVHGSSRSVRAVPARWWPVIRGRLPGWRRAPAAIGVAGVGPGSDGSRNR